MKISVICVYNNTDALEAQLLASLKTQDAEYEFIGLDNRDRTYACAADALNAGAEQATGDILIFSHQDIYLKTPSELEKLASAIASCETGTIVGTQGVREPSKLYYENLTAGEEFDPALRNQFPDELVEVSCVDEGLFGMTRKTWEGHPFDAVLCDNWHLYCVEQCLFARKSGHKVYVWPAQIHHFSYGRISLGYMKNLKKLCAVYRRDFRYIWTTCYKVRTNPVYMEALYLAWAANRFIRGKLQ